MGFDALFYDGLIAEYRVVTCIVEGIELLARDATTADVIGRWPADAAHAIPSVAGELRISVDPKIPGARLVVSGAAEIAAAHGLLPHVADRNRRAFRQHVVIGLAATLALGFTILAYLYGIPLLADRVVGVTPTDWETHIGDVAVDQFAAAIDGGLKACDPDPNSVANRAIARFVATAIEGTGTPFDVSITVVDADVENAFALPGGRAFYFSALLHKTASQDEFAGVMAHEIGHVIYRHGMEQLLASAGTGALVGFVLGDMTGMSVAAAFASTLIDNRFSRDHEREADAYAIAVAHRLAFKPDAFSDLLARIGGEESGSRALSLLSTHPLTADRRRALRSVTVDQTNLPPPFTTAEWRAIKAMCGPPKQQREGGEKTK